MKHFNRMMSLNFRTISPREGHKWKKGNMWSSIFSLVTKVTKHVLVCVAPLQRKIGTKCRGVFLTSQIIYMCRRLLCCHQISRMNLRVSLQLQFSKHLICKHSWQKKHFTMGLHLSNDCAVSHILKHDCKNIAEMQSEQIFLILDFRCPFRLGP